MLGNKKKSNSLKTVTMTFSDWLTKTLLTQIVCHSCFMLFKYTISTQCYQGNKSTFQR